MNRLHTPREWALSRRALLRGLGLGAACLPVLGAERASASITPALICVVQTGGYRLASWLPPAGALDTLPPSLAPLAPFRGEVLVVPGLTNPAVSGTASGYGTILWGQPGVAGDPYQQPTGLTLDQRAARDGIRSAGRRTSLVLGVQLQRNPRPTAAGAAHCSWAGPDQPVEPILDPRSAYALLLAGGQQGSDQVARLLVERKSILDYVGSRLGQFGRRLGIDDRQVIDDHQRAIRDLETLLATRPPDVLNLDDPANYPVIMNAQMDVMLLAMRSGLAQVGTLQLTDAEGSNVQCDAFVPGLSGPATLADLMHNPVRDGVDLKQRVDQWYMQRFADLIAKMKAIPDGSGTFLDHSVVLWANTMEDGATRNSQSLPWLLAGHGDGALRPGRCLSDRSAGRPLGGVLTTLAGAMGVQGAPFGLDLRLI